MSTEVISQPSTAHRGRRKSVPAVVVATVVAVGLAGALVVALSSGGSSGRHSIAEPKAVVSAQTSPECAVDMEYLAAEIGTLPVSGQPGVIASLSPQVRQLVKTAIEHQTATGTAALVIGFAYTPTVPDGPTLARTLAAIPAEDAGAVTNALSPERRAEVGASASAASPAGVCP